MHTAKRSAARLGDRRSYAFPAAIIRGTLLSLLLGTFFLFFLAFLMLRVSDPHPILTYATPPAALLLSLLGGHHAAYLHRKGGLLCGITVGTLLAFLFLITALIMEQGQLPLSALLLYLGVALGGTAGGSLATRKKKRRRR